MKLSINLPEEDILPKGVRVEEREGCRGSRMALRKTWARSIKRYRPLPIVICCEWCQHVGEAQWHCHNPKSVKYSINVNPWTACAEFDLNTGMAMFLHTQWFEKMRAKERKSWKASQGR